MNIAVFADLHGRALLAFHLCRRWETETGEKIDLILQAGDLGVFPDIETLDKATKRYAAKDPSELGFHQFFTSPNKTADAILSELQADMIFVRGNHEDHGYLDSQEGLAERESPIFPVDCYKRIWCIKSGMVYRFNKKNSRIQVLGVGRVDGGSPDPENIQPYEEARALDHDPEDCDILLTHDVAEGLGFFPRTGASGLLRLLVDELKPAYHFFGHVGRAFGPQTYPDSQTVAIKLVDLTWRSTEQGYGPIERGSISILRWNDADQHMLEIVNAAWMDEYTPRTWRHF